MFLVASCMLHRSLSKRKGTLHATHTPGSARRPAAQKFEVHMYGCLISAIDIPPRPAALTFSPTALYATAQRECRCRGYAAQTGRGRGDRRELCWIDCMVYMCLLANQQQQHASPTQSRAAAVAVVTNVHTTNHLSSLAWPITHQHRLDSPSDRRRDSTSSTRCLPVWLLTPARESPQAPCVQRCERAIKHNNHSDSNNSSLHPKLRPCVN